MVRDGQWVAEAHLRMIDTSSEALSEVIRVRDTAIARRLAMAARPIGIATTACDREVLHDPCTRRVRTETGAELRVELAVQFVAEQPFALVATQQNPRHEYVGPRPQLVVARQVQDGIPHMLPGLATHPLHVVRSPPGPAWVRLGELADRMRVSPDEVLQKFGPLSRRYDASGPVLDCCIADLPQRDARAAPMAVVCHPLRDTLAESVSVAQRASFPSTEWMREHFWVPAGWAIDAQYAFQFDCPPLTT
ncbi:hypothetical protein HY632_03130 [Candidatus Uhrbacteria bacterium]|nr:hypothetical protein [Candidatus Uhrbacteria bacterium]